MRWVTRGFPSLNITLSELVMCGMDRPRQDMIKCGEPFNYTGFINRTLSITDGAIGDFPQLAIHDYCEY